MSIPSSTAPASLTAVYNRLIQDATLRAEHMALDSPTRLTERLRPHSTKQPPRI